MILLALDISTKTGYAVYEDGKLIESGTLWPQRELDKIGSPYPFNYLTFCLHCTALITKLFDRVVPDALAIEETTASSNNLSQKQLEYIHCTFLSYLMDKQEAGMLRCSVSYIRDGVWKRLTGATQNDSEKKLNAKISREKKKRAKVLDSDSSLSQDEKDRKKKLPIKLEGKITGKKNRKDYYIRAANEYFGKALAAKDENEAAALLIGLAFLRGAPACDGTNKGGLLPKEPKNLKPGKV